MNDATWRIRMAIAAAFTLAVLLTGCASRAPAPLAPVPHAIGLTGADAVRTLRRAGFRSVVTTAPYPADATEAVVAQDPAPDQPEPLGTRVRILVAVPGPSRIVVPACVGLSWYRAIGELTARNLVGRLVYVPHTAGPVDVVLTQSPRSGSLVSPRTVVVLQVPHRV
jgi:beta-lactam-binding protein with PASTA domain